MHGNFILPTFNPRNMSYVTASTTASLSVDEYDVNGEYTITLPAISTMAANNLGSKTYKIKNAGTSTVTITCNSADKLDDGTSDGASSMYLYAQNDYMIIEADLAASKWRINYPAPTVQNVNVKDDSITGVKMVDGKHYHAVSVDTNGTTAVNVFSASGAPSAMTITGIIAAAKDTVAGDITLTNGTSAVAQFAKSESAGVVTGEDGALTYYSVTAADTLTVVSSSTGNARVTITYTVA